MRSSHSVLVVDDDKEIRDTLTDILQEEGFDAAAAKHGQAALDYLKSRDELPCAIILDLMMPIMDGATFRHRQLEHPELAQVPVVIISAHRDLEPYTENLGAIAQLKKPVNLVDLLAFIRSCCSCCRQ